MKKRNSRPIEDILKELIESRIKEKAEDSIFMEGLNAEEGIENPYEFPKDLDLARMKIAQLPRKLKKSEKEKLKELNEEMDKTEWSRWSLGHTCKKHISRPTKE